MTDKELHELATTMIMDNYEVESDRVGLPTFTAHAMIGAFKFGYEERNEEVIELKKKVQMNIHSAAFNGIMWENKLLKEALKEIQAMDDTQEISDFAWGIADNVLKTIED